MAVNDGWGKPPASDWGKPAELPKIETPAPWGSPVPAPAGTWGNPNPDGSWGAPAGSDAWQTSPPLAPSPAVEAPKLNEWGVPFGAWSQGEEDARKAEAEKVAGAPIEWGKTTETPTWSLNDINGDAWAGAKDDNDLVFPRYFWHAESESGHVVHDAFTLERVLHNGEPLDEVSAAEFIELSERRKAYDDREQQWTEGRISGAEERISVVNSLSGKRDEWVMETDGELNRKDEVIPTVTKGEEVGYYSAYHSGKWLHAILSGPYPTKSAAHMVADTVFKRMTEDSVFQLAFQNKFERGGMYVAEIPLRAKRSGAYGVLA
jgi:hypothetical protein